MTESAAEKKKREQAEKQEAAKKAAAEKAAQEKKDKEAEDKKLEDAKAQTETDVKNTSDADKLAEAQAAAVAKEKALSKDEQREQGLKDIEEAEKNDEEPSEDNIISTVHDDNLDRMLTQASSSEAIRMEKERYLLQQETQKEMEKATQRGLGFNGVRPEGESEKDALG